jgi:hypothetical protein
MTVRSTNSLLSIATLCAAAGLAAGQCATAKLTSTDAASDEQFGTSAAISGKFAIIGCPGDSVSPYTSSGAAYVFEHNGAGWYPIQKLRSGDPGTQEFFGTSVAIDGDYAVVGCPSDTYAGYSQLGSVYVFHRVNGSWLQEFNILSPDNGHRHSSNRFGNAVSISGSTISIAAQYEDNSAGAAYVFTRSGTTWSLQQRIQPSGLGYPDFFGSSISLDANTIAVGATGDDSVNGNATGAVYVFVRTGSSWSQQVKLVGSSSGSSAQVGRSVAISGDKLTFSTIEAPSGVVYSFHRVGTSWFAEAKMLPPNPSQSSYFGQSMSMSGAGTRLAIGRSRAGAGVGGRVGVYERVNNLWSLSAHLVSPENSNNHDFGNSCAISSSGTVIAGDQGNDFAGLANPGAAFVYETATIPGEVCSNAAFIAAGTFFGSTACAAANGASDCGASAVSPDVYYEFVASCTERVTIDTQGSIFDTVLSVHSGCPATAANSLVCNDDIQGSTNRNSAVTLDVAAGQVIWIRVAGYNGAAGAFQLNVAELPLSYDSCAGAIDVGEGQYPFGNCLASTDGQGFGNGCGTGQVYYDLWYRYTAGCNSQVSADTCTGASPASFDTMLAVYGASACTQLDASHLIACNNDSCGAQSALSFSATAGRTYMIRVGSAWFLSSGSGILNISSTPNCPADFNLDGGVDGADVNEFFSIWESGDAAADVNCDGGVDAGDVDTFFAAWQNGGC